MNLNNLKPAWHKFKLVNAMQPAGQDEILLILEKAEGVVINKTGRSVLYTLMFLVLTLSCQGG